MKTQVVGCGYILYRPLGACHSKPPRNRMMNIKQEPFLLHSTSVAPAGYNDLENFTTATPRNKNVCRTEILLRYVATSENIKILFMKSF